jgi:hypothetical protein
MREKFSELEPEEGQDFNGNGILDLGGNYSERLDDLKKKAKHFRKNCEFE